MIYLEQLFCNCTSVTKPCLLAVLLTRSRCDKYGHRHGNPQQKADRPTERRQHRCKRPGQD